MTFKISPLAFSVLVSTIELSRQPIFFNQKEWRYDQISLRLSDDEVTSIVFDDGTVIEKEK